MPLPAPVSKIDWALGIANVDVHPVALRSRSGPVDAAECKRIRHRLTTRVAWANDRPTQRFRAFAGHGRRVTRSWAAVAGSGGPASGGAAVRQRFPRAAHAHERRHTRSGLGEPLEEIVGE